MLNCWSCDPEQRPNFRECLNTLLNIIVDLRRLNSTDSDGNLCKVFVKDANMCKTANIKNSSINDLKTLPFNQINLEKTEQCQKLSKQQQNYYNETIDEGISRL